MITLCYRLRYRTRCNASTSTPSTTLSPSSTLSSTNQKSANYFLVFYFSTQPKLVTDLTTPELAMTSVLNIFCPFVPNLTFQGNAARRNLIKFNIINYTVSFLVNAMLVTFPLVWYGQHFFNTTIPVLDELCLFLHPFVRFS